MGSLSQSLSLKSLRFPPEGQGEDSPLSVQDVCAGVCQAISELRCDLQSFLEGRPALTRWAFGSRRRVRSRRPGFSGPEEVPQDADFEAASIAELVARRSWQSCG